MRARTPMANCEPQTAKTTTKSISTGNNIIKTQQNDATYHLSVPRSRAAKIYRSSATTWKRRRANRI